MIDVVSVDSSCCVVGLLRRSNQVYVDVVSRYHRKHNLFIRKYVHGIMASSFLLSCNGGDCRLSVFERSLLPLVLKIITLSN